MRYIADESPYIKGGWDVRLDGKFVAETRPPGAEKQAKVIADALNGRLDSAKLYAFERLFGRIVEQHEWWQPGVRMGDPDTRYPLPKGHDGLDEWQQRESRAGCRRCKLERLVTTFLEGDPNMVATFSDEDGTIG